MKTVIFELSMPRVASWNGQWSGADKLYAITKAVPNKKAEELMSRQQWSYSWPDGWGARVTCRISTGAEETRKVKKLSAGFCGYNWMISAILAYGEIRT